MEFPHIGTRCSTIECGQLDLLPFICKYCSNIFCKEHFPVTSHLCSKFTNNNATKAKTTSIFCCSQELCTDKLLIKISCIKCRRHFCLLHRTHGCFKQNQNTKTNKLEKREKSKREFLEAKTAVDQEITSKLRKAKNSALAIKIQLMRLKDKSAGPKNIPTTERRYFLVHPPINSLIRILDGSRGTFVSANWSIGKVIDSIVDSLNIPNSNNIADVKKLRMFHYLTGNIVTNQMDMILSKLLNTRNLIDGQDIILEYSNDDKIDCSLY